jgi:hypothetical protein
VDVDQQGQINSVSGASLGGLERPRLHSVTLSGQPGEAAGPAEGTSSRPRLTIVPGGAPSDIELMRCFRAGDWGGFKALYERYFASTYLICRRILASSETALESANDTFLALLTNFNYLDPRRLRSWLRSTAHYLAERRAHQDLRSSDGPWLRLVSCYGNDDSGTGERP